MRHDFGPEGSAYVLTYLRASGRLGPLLRQRDIESGATWALVPSASPPDQRADFAHGGLFPAPGPPIPAPQGVLAPKFDPSSDPQITSALSRLLSRSHATQRLLCVELAYARRTDPHVAACPSGQMFVCGDDVYAYATAANPMAPIARRLGGATWQPNVGIVTHLPHGLDLPLGVVDPEALEAMAGAATAIIVGAWDAEGLLFWEPRDATSIAATTSAMRR